MSRVKWSELTVHQTAGSAMTALHLSIPKMIWKNGRKVVEVMSKKRKKIDEPVLIACFKTREKKARDPNSLQEKGAEK